ncbi:MAG TPA: hypothetical protein PK886_02785 [Candidatus Paceibacterota bacterium]|nr:hypothetical protein [Candidatus Paceibacterota bacterium]
MKKIKLVTSIFVVTALVLSSFVLFPFTTKAAAVTSFRTVLSREKASTLSNYTITFTTPTGVAASAQIVLTFDNSTSIPVALDYEDIDLSDDGSDVTLAAAPSGATWGVVRTSSTVITFTNGSGAVGAGSVIVIEIGTHATSGSTGAEQITNGSAGTTLLTLSGSFGDTGTVAIPIIADDQVVITATVDPTISFSISDNTVGFGTLGAGGARWATGTSGTASAPGATSGAHELSIGTNASGGYSITYSGATLTSGSNTIDVATISGDSDGTPGSEQFALAIADNGGDVTIPSAYDYASNNYSFVAGTTTTLASETAASTTETIDVQYIANIASSTEAGAYSTTITYIATGTF